MTRRIVRTDPAYEAAMREAKVLFDAAMAASAMKGRGRPAAAAAPVAAPVVEAPGAEDLLMDEEITSVAAEAESIQAAQEAEAAEASEPEQAAPAPAPRKAPAKKRARKTPGEAR